MMKRFIFFIVACSLIRLNDSANVLFLTGIPCGSHHVFNRALAIGLGSRGHNVTIVGPDRDQVNPKNVHFVHLEKVYSYSFNGSETISLLDMSRETTLEAVFSFYDFGKFMCEGIEVSEGLNVIKNYPADFKFDLVVHDFTCGPCLLGLLQKFNYPPLVGISAFNNPPYTTDIVGGDKLGLTISPFYSLHYDKNMNFIERVHNGFIHFLDSFYRKYFATPEMDKQMKKMFGPKTPYAGDLEKMHQLMLVNSNPAVDFADSLPPNIIQIGGMQIKEAKPVPDDIKNFIEKGKKGAVFFSLGSQIRSDQLDKETLESILNAFRQIPDYNFLWKFETSELLERLPSNVMIRAWLPQNDILAHPSIKAFISHSGLLSSHEAYWWGVPIVGIPFVADQHRNLHKSVTAGVAVKVDLLTITTDKLKKAINEVLKNPKYRQNMALKSKRFRDQPEIPLNRAVWWCEYIMRNPKPDHLKAAEFNFGLLGSHFWDIQILLITAFVLFVVSLKKIFKKLFSSKPIDNKKKKN